MKRASRILAAIACAMAMGGCMSERAARELGTAFGEALAGPFNVIAQNISGSTELAYASAAFQRKNGRWPKDYNELSAFVTVSDGLLVLGEYERVDFCERADGGVKIAFVPQGQTMS